MNKTFTANAGPGAPLLRLLILSGNIAPAQTTRSWDGGGGDNNWSTAGTWSFDNAPDGRTSLR